MTPPKRSRSDSDERCSDRYVCGDRPTSPMPAHKRRRVGNNSSAQLSPPTTTGRDLLSPLSDELLIRILSFLSLPHLLAVAPVSRRFYHLASDSQLWKALYYARFVLPRAMRIPGFREGATGSGAGHRLHYSGRRTLWADGRRGGLVRGEEGGKKRAGGKESGVKLEREQGGEDGLKEEVIPQAVNWKRQYKIRYNWARGKCAVEELKLGGDVGIDDQGGRKMLVKVVEGMAVTADKVEGLRAWDLKNRRLIAQIGTEDDDGDAAPSSIAIDDAEFEQGVLDVALGFTDGSFGVWRLLTVEKRLIQRYRHRKSSNGELISMALSYPYLLTATQSVLISLYTFEVPSATPTEHEGTRPGEGGRKVGVGGWPLPSEPRETECLSAPYLLTSLDSHTSRPPLALSIRKTAATTIASVAYTFSTRQGWSIGIQDLHIASTTAGSKSAPEITRTRIAYTTQLHTGGVSRPPLTPPATPRRHGGVHAVESVPSSTSMMDSTCSEPGPTTLCYTHPYLLAALPDNTLVLYMCTSNASSLSISPGIRLWGHTSGISDAEITARGKAVSVSSRGEEMRVWELEGRSVGVGSRSVEIRPGQSSPTKADSGSAGLAGGGLYPSDPAREWDERRNWVGFDDEMVIVLKERKGARESLMVYDFT
ncbi:F-box only protein 15 [Madurella mycetomatis]|uniref:F-box only protein 15 n=1 Tax=Madurella mycetomatis TaxID=100816 RepID=A0A175W5Z5_9PEZI|nr:F-box only protein 15 [Madurella mycetomatis]